MTLERYAAPIRSRKVSDIETDDVLRVLSPLWQTRPATASRLRGRIERVLDYAKAHGWRSGENPALWRGHLRNVLPAHNRLARGHHAAMPYPDVPAFVQELSGKEAMAARALEFLILTAARAGEVLGATWAEMDLETRALDRSRQSHESRRRTPRSLVASGAGHRGGAARDADLRLCVSRPEGGQAAFQHGIRDAVAENEGRRFHDTRFPIGISRLGGRRDKLPAGGG